MDQLEIITTLKEIPVTIDGALYKIREMTGAELRSWRKMDGSHISVDEDGRATITGVNMKEPEVELLALCLYDKEDHRVLSNVLQTWSTTALQTLYKVAQDLNGLTRESRKKLEADAKNA